MTRSPLLERVFELKSKGRLPEALRELETALAQRPDDLFLKAATADLLARMKRVGQARQLVDEILSVDPGHQGALTVLGELHLNSHRLAEALEAYRAAALDGRGETGRLTPFVARRQAQVLKQLGRLDDASAVLDRALLAHPDDRSLRCLRADLLYKRGMSDEALIEAQRLVDQDPDDRRARSLLLEIRSSGRSAEEVSRELEGVLATSVGRANPEMWQLKARSAARAGRFAEAGESYLEAHRIRPSGVFLLKQAGFAFRKAGDLKRAIDCLETPFLEDPVDPYVRSCLFACVRTECGPARVLELIDLALARHPDQASLHGVRKKEEHRASTIAWAGRSKS